MKSIREEMAANEGIYPHNKGALSLAEVARRAGIHPQTFHKERYVELAKEVKQWLDALRKGAVVGRMHVRKTLDTRVKEWKQLYEDLLETHRISETDLEVAEEKLRELQKDYDKLQQKFEELRQRVAELTKPKILKLQPKKG